MKLDTSGNVTWGQMPRDMLGLVVGWSGLDTLPAWPWAASASLIFANRSLKGRELMRILSFPPFELFIRLSCLFMFPRSLVLKRCLTTMLMNDTSQDELTILGPCPPPSYSTPNHLLEQPVWSRN